MWFTLSNARAALCTASVDKKLADLNKFKPNGSFWSHQIVQKIITNILGLQFKRAYDVIAPYRNFCLTKEDKQYSLSATQFGCRMPSNNVWRSILYKRNEDTKFVSCQFSIFKVFEAEVQISEKYIIYQ